MSHHGSLAPALRLEAERRLKAGELQALVATASLELGIDIGSVDLVCQIGSARSIATFLQRVGRADHRRLGIPKGRLFPLSRDELVESVAILRSIRERKLDAIEIPQKPLDLLAQQMVACVACEEWDEQTLFERMRSAYPYRDLSREEFDDVLRMLAEGFSTRRGRRAALVHHDAVNHRVRARRGASLTALTSGGAIPDNADYRVLVDPGETFIGTVNEDFAIESMAGEIFQLGNASWRILQVNSGTCGSKMREANPPASHSGWVRRPDAPRSCRGQSPPFVRKLNASLRWRRDSGAAGIRRSGARSCRMVKERSLDFLRRGHASWRIILALPIEPWE